MMFQLTSAERLSILRSKNLTTNLSSMSRSLPYAFTEQGIYMLMTVLKGELAVKQSLALVRMFKQMRQYITENATLFQRLDKIELKQIEADEKFKQIFEKLEEPREKKASIFSAGQLWDAASCIEDIISKAKKSITVIDKYVDKQTLDLLSKKASGVSVVIVTDPSCCKISGQEIKLFTSQYGKLEVKYYKKCHDRYIILDEKVLYHCGASLKDAGKQLFSIDQIEEPDVLKLLNDTVKYIK